MITRSPGIHIGHGYIAGGGYTGCTDELDAVVQEAAEALAGAYPGYDVTIRYNSDRKSGGAFLVTDPEDGIGYNGEIGIGASVVTQDQHDFRAKNPDLYEGEEPFPPVGTIRIMAHVGERVVIDPPEGGDHYHDIVDSIEEAIEFTKIHGDLGGLVRWADAQKKILEERARVFAAYVKTIRGVRRQEYAEACWQALEMNHGEAWCEPQPQRIPYEIGATIRRRVRTIWKGEEIAGGILVSPHGAKRFLISDDEHASVALAAHERGEKVTYLFEPTSWQIQRKVYLPFPMPRWQAEVVAKLRGVQVDADV